MSVWLTIALQVASAETDAGAFDLAGVRPRTLSARCGGGASPDGEVVVCGRGRDRYRLPLPNERASSAGPVRGDVRSGVAALTPVGRCGIFAGERRCGRTEAAGYGYGGGRDPITVLTRLARKAVDRDAD